MTAFELHYAPGSCARVSLVAVEEVNQPFETRLVAFMAGENQAPSFLAINPAGKVPVLVVDGVPLVQNVAILNYLADRFPDEGLLPDAADLLGRAKANGDLACFASDMHPLVTRIAFPMKVIADPRYAALLRETAMERMAAFLAPYEARLVSQPWILGDRWSILDSYLNWVWFRINGGGFDGSKFPFPCDHAVRVVTRPSMVRALAREADAERELKARGLFIMPQPNALLGVDESSTKV